MDKSGLRQQSRTLQPEPHPTSPSWNNSQTVHPGGLCPPVPGEPHHITLLLPGDSMSDGATPSSPGCYSWGPHRDFDRDLEKSEPWVPKKDTIGMALTGSPCIKFVKVWPVSPLGTSSQKHPWKTLRDAPSSLGDAEVGSILDCTLLSGKDLVLSLRTLRSTLRENSRKTCLIGHQ